MSHTIRNRSEVPQDDRWRLEAMFATDQLWEEAYAACLGLPEKIAAHQGKLAHSADELKQAVVDMMDAFRQFEQVAVYAHLRNSEDVANPDYQEKLDRVETLGTRLSTAASWFTPELLKIDDQVMQQWLTGDELTDYRFWLEQQLREKAHTLGESEERLLMMASEPLGAVDKVFSVLNNVDLPARLPAVVDGDGNEVQLSHAGFIKLLENRHRPTRKEAFARYYQEYKGNENTLAATLDGKVKAHVFYARARNYSSAMESSLFADNVDRAVYDSLIAAIHNALPKFYQYMELRRKLLKVDQLHMYDVYVPVVPDIDMHFTWEEAVDLTRQAVKPLGAEYQKILTQGFNDGWIDKYENRGKRSGAFSSGCYDSYPYVLHNYTGTLDSVFTLAHEMGHSMHSWFSHHNQPYQYGDYRILVAEVASITNEALLTQHLLQTLSKPLEKAYVLNHLLESFRGTMFRQTMFAEFEMIIHEMVEKGEALTPQSLGKKYYELVKLYYGDQIAFDAEDEPIANEWSRIPHFYYNFYVYKYATGMASATAISAAILNEGAAPLEKYLNFLKSGGSDYPIELLKKAGVDLTTPHPVESALQEFGRTLDQFAEMMKQV